MKLPELSSDWVRLFLEKTQDLTLFIDDHATVIDVLHSGNFSTDEVGHLIGHPLRSRVGPESLGKIDLLLANDAGENASDARWRHINLVSATGAFIPVLARYLVLRSDTQEAHMVILRDLRAVQAANNRLAAAQREMEYEYNEILGKLESQARGRKGPVTDEAPVEQVLAQIERSSLDKVIAATTATLEKRCLAAILQDSGGKHDVAARVARMPLDAWMDKVRKHKLA